MTAKKYWWQLVKLTVISPSLRMVLFPRISIEDTFLELLPGIFDDEGPGVGDKYSGERLLAEKVDRWAISFSMSTPSLDVNITVEATRVARTRQKSQLGPTNWTHQDGSNAETGTHYSENSNRKREESHNDRRTQHRAKLSPTCRGVSWQLVGPRR